MTDEMSYPIVGVGVIVIKERLVLLIKRAKEPLRGQWSIPGGSQEYGETVRQAAEREVHEETGLTISNLRLIDVVDGISVDSAGNILFHYTLVDFRADWVNGIAKAGSDASSVRWVALEDLNLYNLWHETERVIKIALADN